MLLPQDRKRTSLPSGRHTLPEAKLSKLHWVGGEAVERGQFKTFLGAMKALCAGIIRTQWGQPSGDLCRS